MRTMIRRDPVQSCCYERTADKPTKGNGRVPWNGYFFSAASLTSNPSRCLVGQRITSAQHPRGGEAHQVFPDAVHPAGLHQPANLLRQEIRDRGIHMQAGDGAHWPLAGARRHADARGIGSGPAPWRTASRIPAHHGRDLTGVPNRSTTPVSMRCCL
jgi:hypothetical protein